jgi:uncharacterized protein
MSPTAPAHIYEGSIRHRRFAVRPRRFEHPLALFYLDLERTEEVLGGKLVSSRPGIIRFRREDYLGDPHEPLAETVRRVVEDQSGWRPDGPIRMLSQLRTFGHCFNPVSFYFCFDSGERLGAVLAEVTNTPWGERHAYVLRSRGEERVLNGRLEKQLHVSPFMGMDQHYRWRMSTPGSQLSVHIENHEDERRTFDATLSLRRLELTPRRLRHIIWRYPLASLRVLALIYGHALVLWLKRVPIYAKPRLAA